MSKYNLIDIYEEYQIGSGWTRDFDYDGMLKTGLKTGVDTDIELLKKLAEDFTDVNYHREAAHLYNAIEALEEGATKEASMFFGDFHAEIKATMGDQGMDIEPTLGKFMDARMEENTEAVDLAIETSQEKAGMKEGKDEEPKDEEPRDGVKSAASKLGIKPKHVKEVSSREGSRIEGLLNQQLKSKFLDCFEELYYDLVEEDPFHAEDVIEHLSIEMMKRLDANQAQGDRLAGMNQQEFTAIDEEDSIEEALPKFKGVPPMKDIVKALKDDAKATDSEIKQYMDSVKRAGDEFDDVDDYVEDFKNYVDDKALQEHFGRFMKDYQ